MAAAGTKEQTTVRRLDVLWIDQNKVSAGLEPLIAVRSGIESAGSAEQWAPSSAGMERGGCRVGLR